MFNNGNIRILPEDLCEIKMEEDLSEAAILQPRITHIWSLNPNQTLTLTSPLVIDIADADAKEENIGVGKSPPHADIPSPPLPQPPQPFLMVKVRLPSRQSMLLNGVKVLEMVLDFGDDEERSVKIDLTDSAKFTPQIQRQHDPETCYAFSINTTSFILPMPPTPPPPPPTSTSTHGVNGNGNATKSGGGSGGQESLMGMSSIDATSSKRNPCQTALFPGTNATLVRNPFANNPPSEKKTAPQIGVNTTTKLVNLAKTATRIATTGAGFGVGDTTTATITPINLMTGEKIGHPRYPNELCTQQFRTPGKDLNTKIVQNRIRPRGRGRPPPRPRPFVCPECGKSFLQEAHLKMHVRVVHLQLYMECLACDKQFQTKSALFAHHRSAHLGLRYPCSHLNCGKSFTYIANLRTHEKKVHAIPRANMY